ncbi:NUDIX domain-containing protein [Streptomyces sp. NPDC051364]
MARRDYEDDPDAPAANSLVPAASAVVVDREGRVLLQRRTDNGMWALPGGKMELGESIGQCAARETLEETGVTVEITSRHTLSDLDARVHELRMLDPPEAVALLGRSLRTVRGLEDTRVADDPASAERISVLCGQLPLALRIISALLADLPARPLRSMADALEDTRRRLERLSREDLAVRSAFELSYRHLRSDQALVFRLLPASPGPDVST